MGHISNVVVYTRSLPEKFQWRDVRLQLLQDKRERRIPILVDYGPWLRVVLFSAFFYLRVSLFLVHPLLTASADMFFSFPSLFLARLPFASCRFRSVWISFGVILCCLRTCWYRIGFSLGRLRHELMWRCSSSTSPPISELIRTLYGRSDLVLYFGTRRSDIPDGFLTEFEALMTNIEMDAARQSRNTCSQQSGYTNVRR